MPASGALTVEAVGPNEILATGQLTEVAANEYWTLTLPGLCRAATLLSWRNVLTSGTGTTLNPALRSSEQQADISLECEAQQTAATVYEEPEASVVADSNGVLYYFPGVDAESDNGVNVSIRLRLDWGT